MKFIPLDAVLAEIKRRIKAIPRGETDKRLKAVYGNEAFVLNDLLSFIDTLEVKEVDLEEELIKWHKQHFKKDGTFIGMSGFYLTNSSQMDIAKHFFKLGLNVSSTKVTTPNIDDVLKENGVNSYSKEAKIIKESYFMAIENLAQKGEKV